jgi:hypothetical protein
MHLIFKKIILIYIILLMFYINKKYLFLNNISVTL